MKLIPGAAVVSSIVVTLFLQLLTHAPALCARAPQSMAPGANFNCSSENNRRKDCPTNTSGGVQLVRQRSGSPCTFGQTWGFDRHGVWVDRGCRADFAVGYIGGGGSGGGIPNWPGWGNNYNVYCASDDGRRNRCPVDTRGGVRLVRQRSGSPCAFGTTWGYDRNGVWVDRGCRADFEIGQSGWQPSPNSVVYCASNNMQRNVCGINARGGVRIIRQRSDADCIFNRTWGYDQRGIWVDRGCRADFMVGVR